MFFYESVHFKTSDNKLLLIVKTVIIKFDLMYFINAGAKEPEETGFRCLKCKVNRIIVSAC